MAQMTGLVGLSRSRPNRRKRQFLRVACAFVTSENSQPMRLSRSDSGAHFAQLSLTLLLVIVCGVLAGFWITRLFAGTAFSIPPRVGFGTVGMADPLDRLETSAPLFGSRRPGGPAPNVLTLGVIADANGEGGAIVAVAGQPPRAVRVGDRIEGRLITAIDAKGVTLEGSATRDSVPLIERPHVTSPTSGLGNQPVPPQSPPGYPTGQVLGAPEEQGASMAIPPLENQPDPPQKP